MSTNAVGTRLTFRQNLWRAVKLRLLWMYGLWDALCLRWLPRSTRGGTRKRRFWNRGGSLICSLWRTWCRRYQKTCRKPERISWQSAYKGIRARGGRLGGCWIISSLFVHATAESGVFLELTWLFAQPWSSNYYCLFFFQGLFEHNFDLFSFAAS